MDIFRAVLILVRAFFGNRFVLAVENAHLRTPEPRERCVSPVLTTRTDFFGGTAV
jgi:hypothetical protein